MHLPDDLRSGAGREFLEFIKRLGRGGGGRPAAFFEACQNCFFSGLRKGNRFV
jgi:hypothetical protein